MSKQQEVLDALGNDPALNLKSQKQNALSLIEKKIEQIVTAKVSVDYRHGALSNLNFARDIVRLTIDDSTVDDFDRFVADLAALSESKRKEARTNKEKREVRILDFAVEVARLYQEGKSL